MLQSLGKFLPDDQPYGESWEVADCGNDSNLVQNGPQRGKNLRDLVQQFPRELLGERAHEATEFPILIKYLDANSWLSVQVHPDDAQSPNGVGKNEAWVIMKAAPGSSVFAGLKRGVTRTTLEQALSSNRLKDCLHEIPVSPGDCIHIPAGTVHAIGPGIVLAEVQQQSDWTYRLDDWGRGRELHIAEALSCIDFNRGPIHPAHPTFRASTDGVIEELVHGDYFAIDRCSHVAPFELHGGPSCRIMMVVHGRGRLFQSDGIFDLRPGSTVLVPAASQPAMCIPEREMTVLDVCPGVPSVVTVGSQGHNRLSRI